MRLKSLTMDDGALWPGKDVACGVVVVFPAEVWYCKNCSKMNTEIIIPESLDPADAEDQKLAAANNLVLDDDNPILVVRNDPAVRCRHCSTGFEGVREYRQILAG